MGVVKYVRLQEAAASQDLYGGLLQRCSACGLPNRVGRTVSGGRYQPSSTVAYTDPVTGKSFYSNVAHSNGCAFCGSPAWNLGGSLGDMARRI